MMFFYRWSFFNAERTVFQSGTQKSGDDRQKPMTKSKRRRGSAVRRLRRPDVTLAQFPKLKTKKRKEACRNDLKLFLETYFSQKFKIAWSQDHLIVIKKIEDAVLRGGLFALAMPRSTGKTTISERAAIWATVYAHRRFVALIGATEEAACQILEEIKNGS